MRILKWMLLSLCAALMAGTLASGSSLAAGVVSEWSTDFGDMRLHVDDSLRVSGRYNHQGGEIKGRMTVKGRITAYWLQDSAGRRVTRKSMEPDTGASSSGTWGPMETWWEAGPTVVTPWAPAATGKAVWKPGRRPSCSCAVTDLTGRDGSNPPRKMR